MSSTTSFRPKIRVMIVDSNAIIRAGVNAILEAEADIEVVCQADNGLDAVQAYVDFRPSVVLLELLLPILSGVELLVQLRHVDSRIKAIFLTTNQNEVDITRSIRAGASGYLLKDVSPPDLVAGIRSVFHGRMLMGPLVAERLASRLVTPSLSDREREVLRELVEGLSNKEIAKKLGIATGTAKIHVASVLQKLDVRNRAAAVTVAYKRGLITSGR